MKRRKTPLLFLFVCWLLHIAHLTTAASDEWLYQGYIEALSYGAKLVVRPDSSRVVADTRVSFFCRADGNPIPTITWRRNQEPITDPRYIVKSLPNGLSTLRIEPVRQSDDNAIISCAADNAVGNPVVSEATLYIIPKDKVPAGFPAIDAHPTLKSVEQGRTAHISCRVRGDPRPKVLWLRDLMPIDVRSNDRYSLSTLGNPGALMIQNASESDQGKYECVVRNSEGVMHSKSAHLYVKVRRVPPYFSFPLERVYKVGPGGAVNLTCVAVGYPMPRVFWKKSHDKYLDDPNTAPIGKNVLTLTNVDQTDNYTCIAVSKLGNIEATTTVEVRALPEAPSNLRILEVTSTSVTLSWNPLIIDNEPVKAYIVRYRQKDPARGLSLNAASIYADSSKFREKEVAKDMQTAIIADLEPFQQYEFSVLAVNAIGRGAATMPKETQTGESAPTTPPLKVQARALSRNSVLVRWSPPDKPNGLIKSYKVFYTNQPPSTPFPLWKTMEVKPDEPMATLQNLDADDTYYVHVQAENAKGTSPMSQIVTVITKQGIPGQPMSLQAKALDARRVQLSWEKPLHPSNVIGYTIRFNSSSIESGGRELTLTSPNEKHIVDGLEANTVYGFRVAAQSARGLGAYCEEVTVRTHQSVPSGAPNITDVEAIQSRTLLVKWIPPDDTLHNGQLKHYLVKWRQVSSENPKQRTSDEDDSYGVDEKPGDDDEDDTGRGVQGGGESLRDADQLPELLIDNLNTYTVYEITVAAGTEKGLGPSSEPVRQRTAEDDGLQARVPVPSAPREIEVVQVNASAVKVSWERPLHDNGELLGYYVYKEKLVNGEPVSGQLQKAIMISDPHKFNTLLTDLEANTEYSFRVNAYNRMGDGEFSSSKKIMTGGLPPSEPQTQSVTLLNDDPPLRARISWRPPKITYNMPINHYHVWYKPVDHIDFAKVTVAGTETHADLDGLLMGRMYEIRVAAENDDGLSSNATEQLNTPIGVPEAEPLNVRYDFSDKQMTVSWDPPAIDQRNGNITFYRAILTPLDPGEEKMIQNVTNGRSATYAASPKKAYTFKVAAATLKGLGPYSPVMDIQPDPIALVPLPTNVRVQATSNTSAVVQWQFASDDVDGFVVKYIHEPTGQRDTQQWKPQTVMDPTARHLEITQLTAHRPYAFCVLAIRQNRQGPCSDPPVTIERLEPQFMVSELEVLWKTSNVVMLRWQYPDTQSLHGIKFYVNYTGRKTYLDQNLQHKSMVSPGPRNELDASVREFRFGTLRPYMEYTFHVGVMREGGDVWPREVVVRTDAAGPPFVDRPIFDVSNSASTANIILKCASEEYGPISHYWLIVLPGNFTNEEMGSLNPQLLESRTAQIGPGGPKTEKKRKKMRRYADASRETYIAAGIPVAQMRQLQTSQRPFTLGDNKEYDGFKNWPLDPNAKYKLMMRAFAKEDEHRKQSFLLRPPAEETVKKRYSDSMFSDVFSTRASSMIARGARSPSSWMIGILAVLLFVGVILGMLIVWYMRKKHKCVKQRHGSIMKVALPNAITSNGPTETSKLLISDYAGRQTVNPYEQMNGHGHMMDSSLEMYPLPQHHRQPSNYAPLPVPMPILPSSGGVIGGHSLSHPAIPITELTGHIERLKANNNAAFSQEYESIETGQQFTWDHSNMEVNKPKNRYANVVAYDHSRVILSTIDGIQGSDYINANYIDGYQQPKAYIATQGPLPETFADFWRMVWEEGSVTIVMLTNLEERSRVKCDQYWPSRGSSSYGYIQVTLLDTLVLAHYTIRTMRIQHRGDGEIREIRHLQYTAWPDHGVPDHPTPFLMFLKRVKTLNISDAGPVITHCSAGIGRTGAFIVVDCMLERLRYENTVDIFGCVTALRSQRSYMVQTDDQYIFIHDAVLDAVQSGSTEVPANKLYTHLQALLQIQPMEQITGIEIEFRHLATLKILNSRCATANTAVNKPKNRLVNMIPYDSTRVRLLQITGIDGSDYINASWIDGYRERNAYIATQGPLPHTVNDFWRMVWENGSCIIVMLTKLRELGREKCFEYWPADSASQFGNLVVEPIAEYNMPQYVLREFRITDTQTGQTRTIRHFQYVEWPEQGVPRTGEFFIDFINQVHRTKTQFGVDGPITVHCSTGAGRTGVFIALSVIIERMKLEHVVDVFTTVKLLRTERQNMVQSEEQYQFCYQAALEFLAAYDQPFPQ